MVENCDIVIIGAGTAGIYFGWLMVKKGYSVTIIDKDNKENMGKRLEVIHFETDLVEKAGIPPPKEGTPDFICYCNELKLLPPDNSFEIKGGVLQTILNFPKFLQRMYKIIEEDGIDLRFNCKFIDTVIEENRIIGIIAEQNREKIEIRSRLVVDASGMAAVIRTSLPSDYNGKNFIENWNFGPKDVMYVPIRYIEWEKPNEPYPTPMTASAYYIMFLNPSYVKNGAILGIGQPESVEKANLILDDFIRSINWPPFKVTKEEAGATPFRRPPFTLVGDGFLCIGDSAAITRSYTGHGVTLTWALCQIASEVSEKALQKDEYITQDNLWEINRQYFKQEGAANAYLRMIIPSLINLNEEEMNYILKNVTVITDLMGNVTGGIEVDLSIKQILSLVAGILKGLRKRKVSLKKIVGVVKAHFLGTKIQKLYENYPKTPIKFPSWLKKAEKIWNKKTIVRKEYPSTTVEYS